MRSNAIASASGFHHQPLAAPLQAPKCLAFIQRKPAFHRGASESMIEFVTPDHAERVAGAPAEPISTKYVINMLDRDRWDVKVDAKVA